MPLHVLIPPKVATRYTSFVPWRCKFVPGTVCIIHVVTGFEYGAERTQRRSATTSGRAGASAARGPNLAPLHAKSNRNRGEAIALRYTSNRRSTLRKCVRLDRRFDPLPASTGQLRYSGFVDPSSALSPHRAGEAGKPSGGPRRGREWPPQAFRSNQVKSEATACWEQPPSHERPSAPRARLHPLPVAVRVLLRACSRAESACALCSSHEDMAGRVSFGVLCHVCALLVACCPLRALLPSLI